MAEEDVLVFLSYAHNDDLATTASEDEVGFVTFLCQMLQVKLLDLGVTNAKIWLNRRRIKKGDQFDDVIDEGLRRAELMVVVMSNNWMQRAYCRKELDAFVKLRKASGVPNVRERMIVVGKDHVDPNKRPSELQGQAGYLFYALEDPNDVTTSTSFFKRGKASAHFYDVRDELATFLQERFAHIAEGAGLGTTLRPSQRIATPSG